MLASLINSTNVYRDKLRVQRDATNVIAQVPSLAPKLGQLQTPQGPQTLVFLGGTIPIYFKGVQYNIPVNIWFVSNHPYAPPSAFVIPAQGMDLKPRHKHVDAHGRVYLPYLNQWNHQSSTVMELISFMSSVFSVDPPVYSSPKKPASQFFKQPQPVKQPVQPPVVVRPPAHNDPPPAYNADNKVQAQPVRAVAVAPTDNRGQRNTELMKSITIKLQQQYAEFNKTTIVEMDKLFETQARLREGKEQLEKLTAGLKNEAATLQKVEKEYGERVDTMETWIASHENKAEVSVDEAIQFSDTWSAQLFECVKEDHGIEDTLYSLDKLLADDLIPLDTFLKEVRKLARKQFMARALANKIVEAQRASLNQPQGMHGFSL